MPYDKTAQAVETESFIPQSAHDEFPLSFSNSAIFENLEEGLTELMSEDPCVRPTGNMEYITVKRLI